MAIGTVHNCIPNGNCRMAIINGWFCKIYDNGYAECSLYMQVFSTLAYWNSTSNGFKYGIWSGVRLPGTLDTSDITNKPYEYIFNGASADGYVTSFMLQTNGTATHTPSVTGYSIYASTQRIAIDHNWYVQGFFDFTGQDIKWL